MLLAMLRYLQVYLTKFNSLNVKESFEILDLREGASLSAIKIAFSRLAKKYHPDMGCSNSSDPDPEHFAKILEAYKIAKKTVKKCDSFSEYAILGLKDNATMQEVEDAYFLLNIQLKKQKPSQELLERKQAIKDAYVKLTTTLNSNNSSYSNFIDPNEW